MSVWQPVKYSHNNLSPKERKLLLLCLLPFKRCINRDTLPLYTKNLQKLELFNSYVFDKLDELIQEAIDRGFLSPDSNYPSLLKFEIVFPCFLRTEIERPDNAIYTALQQGFRNYYQDLAVDYEQLMNSKDANERQIGRLCCQEERENLYNALKMSLEKQENISIFFCLDRYFEVSNNCLRRLSMAQEVCQSLEKYTAFGQTDALGYKSVLALYRLAGSYYANNQYQQAEQSCRRVLEIVQALKSVEEKDLQGLIANTYHQLGVIAQKERNFKGARQNYQQALDVKIEYGDRVGTAMTYHQLGEIAYQRWELKEARYNYQQALDINLEYGDRYNCAKTYFAMGLIAEAQADLHEAMANVQKALEI